MTLSYAEAVKLRDELRERIAAAGPEIPAADLADLKQDLAWIEDIIALAQEMGAQQASPQ